MNSNETDHMLPVERDSALDTRRRLAREQQRQVELRRLDVHVALVPALRNPRQRELLLATARDRLERWEHERLCSRDYIQAWRELLFGDLDELCARLAEDSGRARALRQNSPFIPVPDLGPQSP